jgi:hypothetical protein
MKRLPTVFAAASLALSGAETETGGPVMIGSRLELMVDETLIERLDGAARLQLHHPVPREIVFRTDAPWEGNASGYQTVFFHDGKYRMYYRGGHYKHGGKPAEAREPHPWVLCYAESDDGIAWRRPELGIREWGGSTANNIVVDTEMMAAFGGCPAHTSVFVDRNPACPEDARFKIIAYGSKPRGLYVLGSPDGLHFRVLSESPIQTVGAFDSQNLVFWDTVRGEYRMYHRGFNGSVRDVLTAVSDNILSFPEPDWLQYPGSPTMALYTNQIQPYYRAPHIFMGFPMRYCDRGWSQPMLDLPGRDVRVARAGFSRRYGTTVTDAVFMSSRDGITFKRWSDAFIRPGPKQSESWVYGDNFVFWGMVETASIYGDAPPDLSLYVVEGYWEGTDTLFRRHTLRVDGFVSATAPYSGGEVLTRPLVFEGGSLALNVATSAFGSIQVEVQDADGNPIEGYALDECPPIFCDRLAHIVRWELAGGDLRALEGRHIRLRFVLRDADLYAFQFVPYAGEPDIPDLTGSGFIPRKNAEREPFEVINDDFSGAVAGTSPTEDDLNPVIGDGDSGWVIMEGAPDRVQVLNDDPVGSGRPGANPYMKVERREENAQQGGRAWIKLAAQDAADTTNGVVVLEARILVPPTIGFCSDIDAFDNPAGEYQNRAFHIRFFPDGTIKYWRDMHVDVEGVSFTPGEWTDVLIRADLKTSEFDLTVNGRTATGLPFGSPGVHRIQSVALCPNTRNCVLYVDRVRLGVEP